MQQHSEPKVVQDCHQVLLWLIPQLDKLPRQRRFTLGERIENSLIEVLELLVAAAYRRDKAELLVDANRQLEVLRHLWRLAFELKGISMKSYEYGAGRLNDLGRQIGGWQRHSAGGGRAAP